MAYQERSKAEKNYKKRNLDKGARLADFYETDESDPGIVHVNLASIGKHSMISKDEEARNDIATLENRVTELEELLSDKEEDIDNLQRLADEQHALIIKLRKHMSFTASMFVVVSVIFLLAALLSLAF